MVERCNTWESPLEVYQRHRNRAAKTVNDLLIIVSKQANDFLFLAPSLPFSGSWPSTCFSSVYAVALSLIRCRSKNIVGFSSSLKLNSCDYKVWLLINLFLFYRSLWKCIPNFRQTQQLLGITKDRDRSLFLTTHLLSKTKTCNKSKRKISALKKLFDKVFLIFILVFINWGNSVLKN